MRALKRGWAAAVAALALTAPAAAQQDIPQSLAKPLQTAMASLREGKCDASDLRATEAHAAFKSLPGAVQALIYIGLVDCVGGARVDEWLKLATAPPDAPAVAWALRFAQDVSEKHDDDALADLEAGVARAKASGDDLGLERDDTVFYLRQRLRHDTPRSLRFLSALDAADWSPHDPSQNPSPIWLDLSLMLMDAGRTDDAERVAGKVNSANALFGMRLDNRFVHLRQVNPAMFDIEFAAFAELERQRKLTATATDDNSAYELIDALRTVGRYDEALAYADTVLQKPKIVDDEGNDYRNWIEDRRAYVLLDMGRIDEAIVAERKAAARPERGHANVSQVINLGEMLVGQGQFHEALELLAPLDKPGATSPLGAGFVAGIRVCAYNGLGDAKAEKAALDYTEAHVGDNRHARLRALLCSNDTAGAAALMIAWLQDPIDREDALLELCTAPDRPLGAYDKVLSQRFAMVRKDPAVVAAAAAVGHTERLTTIGARWPSYPGE